jgi:glucuronate isomerase
MEKFMDENFMLSGETARVLYHDYAEKMPIIDYHCHIDPREIANNRRFDNITQLWLGNDHYKWRMIRTSGVDEKCITGSGSDKAKFLEFARVLPRAIGNPLYHWTHLELKRYFGYDGLLNAETAEKVWELCNARLKTDELSVRGIIKRSNVKLICTTDDPADSLEWHEEIRKDRDFSVRVVPAWRPDKIINIDRPGFVPYVSTLSKVAGREIHTLDDVFDALLRRMDFFETMGCKTSDHGIAHIPYFPGNEVNESEIREIFAGRMAGESLAKDKVDKYEYFMLLFLGKQYAKRGWVMQLHFGALRNVNGEMFGELGPDTGYDCIGERGNAGNIAGFLNSLNDTGELPKTILYSLNFIPY